MILVNDIYVSWLERGNNWELFYEWKRANKSRTAISKNFCQSFHPLYCGSKIKFGIDEIIDLIESNWQIFITLAS